MGLPGVRIDNDRVVDAIIKARGNLTYAAKLAGCTRQAICKKAKRVQKIADAIEEAREITLDNAESALHQAALKGEGWAVMFTLRTIGRNRGYVEKTETEVSGGITIRIDKEDAAL